MPSKRELLELAKDCFYKGTSPPDVIGVWRGKPPAETLKIGTSRITLLKSDKKVLPDGTTNFKGVYQTVPAGWGDAGVFSESGLISRFVKFYGKAGAEALSVVFLQAAKKMMPKVPRHLNSHPNLGHMLLDKITGYGTLHGDWTAISFKITSVKPDSKLTNDLRVGELALGFKAWFEVVGRQELEVTETPFTDMSDRELDGWIDTFAYLAPENYHMDGEFQGSDRQKKKYWRDRFRKKRPREQQREMEYLKKYKSASSRVARRHLEAAEVGTDTASFYVIAPEQLHHIIEDGEWAKLAEKMWGENADSEDFPFDEMTKIIRQHGGAMLTTGHDGASDVGFTKKEKGQKEEGMLPYAKKAAQVVSERWLAKQGA
jgi:hypothetical protein